MGVLYHYLVAVVNYADDTLFMHDWGNSTKKNPKVLWWGRGGGDNFQIMDNLFVTFDR